MVRLKQEYLILGLIIILGLWLASLLYSGPFYSFDDANYITYAHQILSGTFNLGQSPYAYGFLMPGLLAVSLAIFGTSISALILPSILEYVIIIILAFLVGRKLYGDHAGIISAALAATAPFLVGYATRVLPDTALGVLAGASVLVFIYSEHSKNKRLLYFISGALAALTIYFKLIGLAYILFFIIGLLIYWLCDKKTKSNKYDSLSYPLAGLVLFVLLYASILLLSGVSPIAAAVSYGQNQNLISPSNFSSNVNSLINVLTGYPNPNNQYAPLLDPQVFPFGLLILFTTCGTALGLIKKEKSLILMSLLFWGVLLYLFFGTVSLTSYSFITVISRYFILVSVPLFVLSAYALQWLSKIIGNRFKISPNYVIVSLVALIILSNLPVYNALYNYNLSISGDLRSFSSLLGYLTKNSSTSSFITDSNNGPALGILAFLSQYNKTLNIMPLNILSRENVSAWVNEECSTGANTVYLILQYQLHSESTYSEVLNNWIPPYCNLAKVESLNDNKSSSSTYNGMNVVVDIYKAN